MRVFIISDIHGMFCKLQSLINKIFVDYNFNNEDLLVFVGDYIDRGEQSFEVVDFLCNLKNKNNNIIFLKGNHEDMLLNCVRNNITYDCPNPCGLFIQNGGFKTIESYMKHGHILETWDIPKNHKYFFQSLKLYYETDDIFICHAGVNPDLTLNKQRDEDLLWIRKKYIYSDKNFGKIIISGHTIVGDTPVFLGNKILIDTGAFMENGQLTCLILPELEYLQT